MMNCMMCHAKDGAACYAPAQTVYFIEATNRPSSLPPSSVIPPDDAAMAFRHGGRATLLKADFHVENLKARDYLAIRSLKQFWYPNDKTGRSSRP